MIEHAAQLVSLSLNAFKTEFMTVNINEQDPTIAMLNRCHMFLKFMLIANYDKIRVYKVIFGAICRKINFTFSLILEVLKIEYISNLKLLGTRYHYTYWLDSVSKAPLDTVRVPSHMLLRFLISGADCRLVQRSSLYRLYCT